MNYKRKLALRLKRNKLLFFINNIARVIRDFFFYINLKVDVQSDSDTRLIDLGPKTSVFCGYYDISPFNENDDNLILIHSVNQSSFFKSRSHIECNLVLFNLRSNQQVILGKTRSWNWQQGARLGWLDRERVVYNDYDSNADLYYSNIVNIFNGESSRNDFPVMAWTSSKYFCSLDFKRLNSNNTDYGYDCHKKGQEIGIEGIKIYNLKGSLVFNKNILELLDELKLDYVLSDTSYVNHPLFNPNGSKMIFLFRYVQHGHKYHHLFLWEESENDISYLGNFLVSHYCWLNNDQFVFWGEGLGGQRGYNIYCTPTRVILDNFFLDYPDGHPVLINEENLLFDTYNSKDGKNLSICGLSSQRITNLLTLREFPSWSFVSRCDFHPSISGSKSFFQGDVNFNGYRKVLLYRNKNIVS